MATQPSFTWSKLSGRGSITKTGLYTAPASGTGTAVIQAKAGGKSGTATVHITTATLYARLRRAAITQNRNRNPQKSHVPRRCSGSIASGRALVSRSTGAVHELVYFERLARVAPRPDPGDSGRNHSSLGLSPGASISHRCCRYPPLPGCASPPPPRSRSSCELTNRTISGSLISCPIRTVELTNSTILGSDLLPDATACSQKPMARSTWPRSA